MRGRTGTWPAGLRLRPRLLPLGVTVRAAEEAGVFLTVVDARGRVRLMNRAMRQELGFTRRQVRRTPFHRLWVAPEHEELAQDAIARAIAEGRAYPQEADWLDRDGGRRRVTMHNTVLTGVRGRPWAVVTVGVDVTEQRQQEARLRARAETDPLTGLRNRGALFDALRAALGDGGAGCGVLFCDLDDFKAINDAHGHEVGDQVLMEVARRILVETDPHDLVARLGGDEFVVMTPETDATRLDRLAERAMQGLAEPVPTSRGPIAVSMSVGVAVGAQGDVPDDLVAASDTSMYGAKWLRRRERRR